MVQLRNEKDLDSSMALLLFLVLVYIAAVFQNILLFWKISY